MMEKHEDDVEKTVGRRGQARKLVIPFVTIILVFFTIIMINQVSVVSERKDRGSTKAHVEAQVVDDGCEGHFLSKTLQRLMCS